MFAVRPLLGLTAACLLFASAGPVRAERPPALRALIVKYRCPIYGRLVRIHDAGDLASDRDRFIAVSVPDGRYVQCLFHDGARMVLCEAASGYYEAKEGEPRTAHLPPAAIARLGRLGFSTDDSAGNFRLDRGVGDTPDDRALADLILCALYVAYDARADMALSIAAPFAPLPGSTCDATS